MVNNTTNPTSYNLPTIQQLRAMKSYDKRKLMLSSDHLESIILKHPVFVRQITMYPSCFIVLLADEAIQYMKEPVRFLNIIILCI